MAMRNYGAMLDPKLMQCIAELRSCSGEAYEKVLTKTGGGPQASVEANLSRALTVAEERGLMLVPRSEPEPEPELDVCRGCAGTGVDITCPTRLLQIAVESKWNVQSVPATKFTAIGLGVGRGSEPLATLLQTISDAQSEGRSVRHALMGCAFPLTKEHACTWCNGTGVPTY